MCANSLLNLIYQSLSALERKKKKQNELKCGLNMSAFNLFDNHSLYVIEKFSKQAKNNKEIKLYIYISDSKTKHICIRYNLLPIYLLKLLVVWVKKY